MSLNLDIFSILVLLGACQGLIISLFLFMSKKAGIKGKNYLGFFMLILAYNGLETFSWSAGIDNTYFRLFFECFSFTMIFGLGPGLYLYVKSLTTPEFRSSGSIFVHFLPLILRTLIRIALVIYALFWNNGIGFTDLSPMDLDWWDVRMAEPLSVLVFCAYLLFSFKELSRFNNKRLSAPVKSPVQEETINRWLIGFLQYMAVFTIIWIATVLSPMIFNIEYGPHFYVIEVLLVFFIYWLAFVSYYRTKVVYVQPQKQAPLTNGLSLQEMNTYSALIKTALEKEKLYRDPDLTVGKLAAHIKVNPKSISATLNQHLKKGFSECINTYRIEEVKEKLLDPQNSYLTISGIALESGFNSQATFQRVFKNSTGMSPKEFIASQPQKKGYNTSQIGI